jgi:uncharacterized protein
MSSPVRSLQSAEWPATVNVDHLLASGFIPTPFSQFVVKLSARCDLACDYCYMFSMADQGWRHKPARMSSEVFARTAERIAEHARTHNLATAHVVLHGGEPLLSGPATLEEAAQTLKRLLPGEVELDLRIQTNGLRLSDAALRVLTRHSIRVGVSLDGDRTAHNRHRRFADGRGSYDAVRASLAVLTERHPELFAGLLCAVDLRNDPVATYESLVEFSPPTVDFLLPHGTWSAPPPGLTPAEPGVTSGQVASRPTPYGDWLVCAFDRWYPVARKETSVRFFAELMVLLLGGRSRIETIGLSPSGVVVIDTDGSIEQVDTLRAAFEGAAHTGLTVGHDSFDSALRHPGVVARQLGVEGLCRTCRECPVHQVCGAGYFPHRYRRGSGFLNPSVYCGDMRRVIEHVTSRVRHDLAVVSAPQAPKGALVGRP